VLPKKVVSESLTRKDPFLNQSVTAQIMRGLDLNKSGHDEGCFSSALALLTSFSVKP
jgi:hypothetical protein